MYVTFHMFLYLWWKFLIPFHHIIFIQYHHMALPITTLESKQNVILNNNLSKLTTHGTGKTVNLGGRLR